ncbi:antibiotic biosynthesis monooxygenase family protein [Aminobacter sp. LjRoot7]|uniref:antibiotic biosynthesis monooxygenase family protein n=1 Tax=Aminobacter sp. LjRoot7 TaxID=3342335 RepID=UPI003ECCCA6B
MSQNAENEQNGPVAFVNIFTLKPGKLDEFIALQKINLDRSVGNVPGWRGSRLHRAIDGDTAIMISTFDSVADHNGGASDARVRRAYRQGRATDRERDAGLLSGRPRGEAGLRPVCLRVHVTAALISRR